jgi:hypothetical protein
MNLRTALSKLDKPTKNSMCQSLVANDMSLCLVPETKLYISVVTYDSKTYRKLEQINHWYLLEKR